MPYDFWCYNFVNSYNHRMDIWTFGSRGFRAHVSEALLRVYMTCHRRDRQRPRRPRAVRTMTMLESEVDPQALAWIVDHLHRAQIGWCLRPRALVWCLERDLSWHFVRCDCVFKGKFVKSWTTDFLCFYWNKFY